MQSTRIIATLALLLASAAASATDIGVTSTQAPPGGSASVTISLANVSGASTVSARLNYATPELAAASVVPQGGAACDISTPGQVNLSSATPADGTQCVVTFNVAPNADPLDYPLFWTQESCPGDPSCLSNNGFFTVLGPNFTSFETPGMPLFVNGVVGGAAPTTEVNTSNNGTTDLTILPSGLSAPLSVTPTGTQTLAPSGGDVRTIFTVTCDTADGGTSFQTLNLATNDPDEASVDFPISCTIDGPEAELSPPSGEVAINTGVGVTGTTQILVRNLGTQPLTITPSSVPAPFTTDGTLIVPPGGPRGAQGPPPVPFNVSCNSPTGGSFTAPLTLATTDANEPSFGYTLRCNVGPPDVNPTPPAGTTLAITTPLSTTGTTPLAIRNDGGAFLFPSFSGLTPPLSIVPGGKLPGIPPGQTSNFSVECNSAVAGTFSQVLTFSSNDPDENPITWPVSCTVGGAELDPTPAAGTTIALQAELGASANASITIANPGAQALTVDASGLSGDLAIAPARLVVAPGGSGTLSVDCTPSVEGVVSQTLTLASNDPDEATATYPVQCTGIDPGVRAMQIVQGNNQVAVPNGQGQPLVVLVTQGPSPVAGEPIAWRVASGSDVTLAQTFNTTNAQGQAQTGISYGPAPTAATIEATDSQGTTVRFDISPPVQAPPAVFLAIASGDNQTGATGTSSDAPIVFETRTGDLSPAPGVQLQFTVASGDIVLPVASGATDSNGQLALTFRYGATAGPAKIRATIAGTPSSVEATATSFAPRVAAASGNNQAGAPGQRLAQPLVVAIAPAAPGANAKGLAGASVAWTVVAGGGSVAPASNQTDATGRASAQLTLGPAAGLNQVRATVAGAGSVTFNATATSGGAIVLEIASGNNQALGANQTSAPLVVRARDGGTPLPGVRVRWTPSSDDVQVSATENATASSGEASVTATLRSDASAATVFVSLPDFPSVAQVQFVLSRGLAAGAGGTTEEEVGAALDTGCAALEAASASGQALGPAQRDLLARCRELSAATGNTPGTVDEALGELAAEEVEAQNTAVVTAQSAQFGNLKARIAALRSGQNNSFGGLALNTAGGPLPLSFLPASLLMQDDAGGTSEAGAEFSRLGFFASGTIGSGDRDPTDTSAGFDFSNYGLTAGIDYRVSDSLILGAALGFGNNDTDLDDDGGALDTRSLSVSGYATYYRGDSFYVDGVLTFGRNDFDVARRIDFAVPALGGGVTVVDQLATADTSGNQTSLAVSFGKDFVRGAWLIGPYLRGTYTKIDFDGYVEEVSDPSAPGAGLALEVQDRELVSNELVLGGKLTYTKSTSWGILMPHVNLEFLHELEDDADALVTRFVSDPTGTPIVIESRDADRSYFNLGLGLSAVFANGKSAFVYYEHRAAQEGMTMDNLAIGVRIEF
jgi:outer membrane autotransporter protein